MKFKEVDLVEGWLVDDDTSGRATEWVMREVDDCRSDLEELAKGMIEEMKSRRVDGLPHLLVLLSGCLDFGDLSVVWLEGEQGWINLNLINHC